MGADRFGQPWPPRQGEVYRISETADDKTGLFEVEILLNNQDERLKPGQIALAKIVIDELTAFRLPIDCVLFRGETPYFYAVQPAYEDLQFLFWQLGRAEDPRAAQIRLDRTLNRKEN